MAEQLSAGPFLGSDAVARRLVTRHLLRGPSWRRLMPDVYIGANVPLDHRVWCRVVALALRGDAVVDRYSAACLHGVDLVHAEAPVTVSLPKDKHPRRHPHVRTFRTMLSSDDIVVLDGIPVTTPLRTAFDLGRQTGLTPAVVALDALCHRHLVTVAELADYAHSRRQLLGARMLLRRLPLVEPRSESPMESRLRLSIVMAGLPAPVAQYEVRDARNQLIGRLDLAWPHLRVAAEYDGDHHRGQLQFRRDVARLNALREAGWLVLRFTAPDLSDRPAETVRQIAAALDERR